MEELLSVHAVSVCGATRGPAPRGWPSHVQFGLESASLPQVWCIQHGGAEGQDRSHQPRRWSRGGEL